MKEAPVTEIQSTVDAAADAPTGTGILPGGAGELAESAISSNHLSLEGMHSSVVLPPTSAGFWRQWRAFVGPAILVSVGYMDPGNWGTDLQGGAMYKYQLLWVIGMASIMAIFLQVISARLGVATGKDLAQACRDWYPKWTRWPNWLFCEVAIGACDLAEALGSAVALNLLFHIPMLPAILITAFDVLLLLALQGLGMRLIEAIVAVFVATIGICYAIEIFGLPQTQPSFLEMGKTMLNPDMVHGAWRAANSDMSAKMWVLAIAMIGATVMPHNLYLHSALVQSRQLRRDDKSVRNAIRFNTIDSVVALTIAFFVNAAILVLAAMVFYGKTEAVGLNGVKQAFSDDSDWIRVAYLTLSPLLGPAVASTLFAVALLASGQSSTITGTLAGQVVMEGFMHWRIRPWVRRMITRTLAVLPAIFIIGLRGQESNTTDLINLSQAVLALQLPLAMFPLLHFTSSKKRMGLWRNGWFLLAAGWGSALVITAMDLWSLPDTINDAWHVIFPADQPTGPSMLFAVLPFLFSIAAATAVTGNCVDELWRPSAEGTVVRGWHPLWQRTKYALPVLWWLGILLLPPLVGSVIVRRLVGAVAADASEGAIVTNGLWRLLAAMLAMGVLLLFYRWWRSRAFGKVSPVASAL